MKVKGRITVRQWQEEDIPGIIECHKAVYGELYEDDDLYGRRVYNMQFSAFPEGQFLAEINGKIVGYATSIIVQLDDDEYGYTYQEITGSGTFSTHSYGGDTLYGADIAVHPDFRRRGIARGRVRRTVGGRDGAGGSVR